jgi:hypothetical protein
LKASIDSEKLTKVIYQERLWMIPLKDRCQ